VSSRHTFTDHLYSKLCLRAQRLCGRATLLASVCLARLWLLPLLKAVYSRLSACHPNKQSSVTAKAQPSYAWWAYLHHKQNRDSITQSTMSGKCLHSLQHPAQPTYDTSFTDVQTCSRNRHSANAPALLLTQALIAPPAATPHPTSPSTG